MKKKHWILLGSGGCALVLIVLVPLVVVAIIGVVRVMGVYPEQSPRSLMDARSAHTMSLVESAPFDDYALPVAPDGLLAPTAYEGPLGTMRALATPIDLTRAPQPAVIWITGGFGGIAGSVFTPNQPENDQGVTSFLGREIVLFLPALRGEHGNPGVFECFYGEVDDVVAAVEHVANRPDVDPERIYLMGHSTGGTNVLLASMLTDIPAGVVSFGGAPSMEAVVDGGEGYGVEPYDLNDTDEVYLRSPIHFAKYIRCPVLYVEGIDSSYPYYAHQMELAASMSGRPMSVATIEGADHFSVLRPIKDLLADRIEQGRLGFPSPESIQQTYDAFDFTQGP